MQDSIMLTNDNLQTYTTTDDTGGVLIHVQAKEVVIPKDLTIHNQRDVLSLTLNIECDNLTIGTSNQTGSVTLNLSGQDGAALTSFATDRNNPTAGNNGFPGGNVNISVHGLMKLNVPFNINTSGGSGGQGQKGHPGDDGEAGANGANDDENWHVGWSAGQPGTNGGGGYLGGNGGNGGRGGDIIITAKHIDKPERISTTSNGGSCGGGGQGGDGGHGGPGGVNGVKVKRIILPSYPSEMPSLAPGGSFPIPPIYGVDDSVSNKQQPSGHNGNTGPTGHAGNAGMLGIRSISTGAYTQYPKSFLRKNEYLTDGQYMVADDSRSFLHVADGAATLYLGSSPDDYQKKPVWQSSPKGLSPCFLVMQIDNNLALYHGTAPTDNRGFMWDFGGRLYDEQQKDPQKKKPCYAQVKTDGSSASLAICMGIDPASGPGTVLWKTSSAVSVKSTHRQMFLGRTSVPHSLPTPSFESGDQSQQEQSTGVSLNNNNNSSNN